MWLFATGCFSDIYSTFLLLLLLVSTSSRFKTIRNIHWAAMCHFQFLPNMLVRNVKIVSQVFKYLHRDFFNLFIFCWRLTYFNHLTACENIMIIELLCSVTTCIKGSVSPFIAGFKFVLWLLFVKMSFSLHLDNRLCL